MSDYVEALIDKAAEKAGNHYRLAKMMDVAPSRIWDWRSGRDRISPADRARVAGFAGEDAVQELVRATLEHAKGDVRKEQLHKLLEKSSRAIGVAIASVLLAISLTFSPKPAMAAASHDVYYVY